MNRKGENIENVKIEAHLLSNKHSVVIEKTPQSLFVFDGSTIIKTKQSAILKEEVYIGDHVELNEKLEICSYTPRKNVLSREKKDATKRKQKTTTQIVACNIDLAIIVVSAKEPPLHPRFIDRYCILLESFNIPFLIVINKSDLITSYEKNIIALYKNLGMKVIETSTIHMIGIRELRKEITGKRTILVGNSGVGKSSLINALFDEDKTKISSISEKSKRGCHTTTSTKYYVLDDNSSIIDTPGIRSLDLSNFTIQEVKHYFKEMGNYEKNCQYNNCLHINEDTSICAVKEAVRENKITKERYESYRKIINELQK